MACRVEEALRDAIDPSAGDQHQLLQPTTNKQNIEMLHKQKNKLAMHVQVIFQLLQTFTKPNCDHMTQYMFILDDSLRLIDKAPQPKRMDFGVDLVFGEESPARLQLYKSLLQSNLTLPDLFYHFYQIAPKLLLAFDCTPQVCDP